MLNPLRSGNTDRYYDYHQEKGHYTNDCIQLRTQLEMALESGKLNHLVKDVRQRGRGSHGRDAPQPAKIINVISVNSVKDKKRKIKNPTSHPIHHSLHDEIPNPQWRGYFSHPYGHYRQMQTSREETDDGGRKVQGGKGSGSDESTS
ncbi:hypothetical protein Tco_0271943 [Tanacetum coccineum]